MQRKRILFIVPRFGTINRGVESFALELISRLDKKNFDITVLSNPHEIEMKDVRFIKIKTLKRECFKWLDQAWPLTRIARKVYLGSGSDFEAAILYIKSKSRLKNEAFEIVMPFGGTWTYRLAKHFMPQAHIISVGHAGPVKKDLQLSDYFVALTPFDEDRAKYMLPSIPTTLIPNGIDLNKFKPASETKKSEFKVILCVAALTKDKRHDLLFDAVMLLPRNVNVLCVGSGSHYLELTKHPLYQAGRVEFRSVSYEEMPNVYHEADIFSLASPDEAFGIVFLEAIASGLRVVAHNGPRQQFVVGKDRGSLANCYNASNYAECLMNEITSSACLPNKPPSLIKRFDWQTITTLYENLFHKISGKKVNI